MIQVHQILLLSLLLLSYVVGIAAWGPIFESKKGGFRSSTTRKAALGNDGDMVGSNRLRLERTFLFEVGEEVDELLLPYRKYESTDYTVFTSFELGATCTDDCDECAIPDEYKNVFPAEEQIDVMAFLGIRRAEPLRVNRREWE